VHYGEEGNNQSSILLGGDDGVTYELTGTDDAGTAIGCHVRTAYEDQGDARLQKLYGDVWFDADTKDTDIKVKLGYDNYSSVGTGRELTTDPRDHYPIEPRPRAWVTAKNICADMIWRASVAGIKLYTWEPRWHEESAPVAAKSWMISETDFGLDNFIHTGYIFLPHVSTADLTLTFTVDGTDTTVTIAHGSGSFVKTFQRLPVMKGKLWQLKLTSTAEFRIDGQAAELLMKQWGVGGQWLHVPMFTDLSTSELTS